MEMPDDIQPDPEGTSRPDALGRGMKRIPFRRRLAQPSLEYRSRFGRWLARGESVDDHAGQALKTHPWWKVMRYWDWTPEEDIRPLIFLMSD